MANMNSFARQYHEIAAEGCVDHDIDDHKTVHICYIIFKSYLPFFIKNRLYTVEKLKYVGHQKSANIMLYHRGR